MPFNAEFRNLKSEGGHLSEDLYSITEDCVVAGYSAVEVGAGKFVALAYVKGEYANQPDGRRLEEVKRFTAQNMWDVIPASQASVRKLWKQAQGEERHSWVNGVGEGLKDTPSQESGEGEVLTFDL